MKVLVTGASGFVGRALVPYLVESGHQVIAALRRPLDLGVESRMVGELGPETDWSAAVDGMDAVIHLAARAHVMDDESGDVLGLYRRINRDGTLRLAEQARTAGVRRFVFVSTIKVNGEETAPDRPFRPDAPPAPTDPYGIAKAEAEEALRRLTATGGMELVILRPPLIHGPGAKGNLAALLRLLQRGVPLPLGSVGNKRSLIGLDNLVHALDFLLSCPQAAGKTLLIRDDEDVSVTRMIELLAIGLNHPARLVPVPPALLRLVATVLGRQAMAQRLLGSLTVDDSSLRALGWTPPVPLADGLVRLGRTARA